MSSKIGIYEFNQLPFNEKAETVNSIGYFITNAFNGDTRYNLYRVFDFYVEAVYQNSKNKIIEFNSFKKGFRLDRYIDEVDIDELY